MKDSNTKIEIVETAAPTPVPINNLPLPKTLSGQNTAYTFANQHITTNV